MNRRGFLAGLLSAIAAPAIVKASGLMPIKNYDVFHRVVLEGIDIDGSKIAEIIDVPETLISGLNMDFYKSQCEIIRPKFKLVDSISWNKAMPLRRVVESNGWSMEDLKAMDDHARDNLSFNRPGSTCAPIPDEYFEAWKEQFGSGFDLSKHLS